MYSATLESSPIDPLIRQLSRKKASNEKVIKRLQSLKQSFKRYSKPASETVDKQVAQLAPLDNFNNTLETLIETIHQWLATQTPSDTVDAVVDYYLECRRYF